jgi:ribosomal protein S18 acetylase RimI-like enzyme
LVADDGGHIVGSVIAAWDGWRGELYRLAVSPSHRRAGLATKLVREGERRLLEQGARRISVLVLERAELAKAFWRSAGYRPDDAIRRAVRVAD